MTNDEPPVLVRIVTGVRGTVEMNVTLRVRFGYGSIVPWLTQIKDGIRATAGPDAIWLRTPVQMTGRDLAHIATFSVAEGESVPFVAHLSALAQGRARAPGRLPVPRPDQEVLVRLGVALHLRRRLTAMP